MTAREPSGLPATGAAATSGGAAVVATAAAACCSTPAIASLTVTVLGGSGAAWAAGFAPYANWLLVGSALALGYGFWSAARAARRCGVRAAVPPRSVRWARWALGAASILWLVAVTVRLAPLLS